MTSREAAQPQLEDLHTTVIGENGQTGPVQTVTLMDALPITTENGFDVIAHIDPLDGRPEGDDVAPAAVVLRDGNGKLSVMDQEYNLTPFTAGDGDRLWTPAEVMLRGVGIRVTQSPLNSGVVDISRKGPVYINPKVAVTFRGDDFSTQFRNRFPAERPARRRRSS